MKIYTHVAYQWNGTQYVEIENDFGIYDDRSIALCCGPSAGQTTALNQQTQLTQQIMQQGQQVFGSSSQVFSDLVSTLAPTVAAGPNQEGFSQAELSNLQSQAITNGGNAYKNAKAATGDAISAEGGGNTGLTSGANIGIQENLASSAAENTANELGQINEANYATGRQNYDTAISDLAQTPNVFNSATSLDNAGTNSAEGEANTANQIATQNNSWMQAVTGALGGVAGSVVTGGMKNLGSGVGFFGQNA